MSTIKNNSYCVREVKKKNPNSTGVEVQDQMGSMGGPKGDGTPVS